MDAAGFCLIGNLLQVFFDESMEGIFVSLDCIFVLHKVAEVGTDDKKDIFFLAEFVEDVSDFYWIRIAEDHRQ